MSLRPYHLATILAVALAAPALPAQSLPANGPFRDQSRAGVSAQVVSDAIARVPALPPAAVDAPVLGSATAPTLVPQPASLRRRGVPQMIIGGVAIIGGAIIGDDVGTIVSLGGLGYGLYGLYLYLN
jgi:hypothetical protein